MKNRRNYYRLLHIQPDAPPIVVKAAYFALMHELRTHPDLDGDYDRAAWLDEAFATLSDPVRRAEYHRQLKWMNAWVVEHPIALEASASPQPEAERLPQPEPACLFCGGRLSHASEQDPQASCSTCGSALWPVNRTHAGTPSRRSLDRLRRDMPIRFRRSVSRQREWTGTTEDISLNGMRFRSSIELSPGERLQVDCEFCSAVGVVKSVQRGTERLSAEWVHGLEFERLRIVRDHGGLLSTVA